jgi:molybdenum cofactor cytidylyltransferase
MSSRGDSRVTGLVLAAGSSRRLGQPKQLLPYGDATMLDHTLDTARACDFDQLLCVLGGASAEIHETVDLAGVEIVENPDFGEGCSSSIAAAVGAIDRRSEVLVLMLGDQPGVTPEIVAALLAGRGDAPLAVCSYQDGRGHPLAFARALLPDLAHLHGDKAVWTLLDHHAAHLVEVAIASRLPLDIDTWADYRTVLAKGSASSGSLEGGDGAFMAQPEGAP